MGAEESLTITEGKKEPIDFNNISLGTEIQLYFIAGLSTCATFITRAFTGLYAVFIESTASALSLITSLRNLIQQVFQITFGRISDRIGRKIIILIGLIGSGVSVALFPLIKNGWVLVGGVVAFSISFSMFYPAFTAIQGDLTSRKNRAGFISLITLVGAFASLIGLLVVGFAGDLGGDNEFMQHLIILEISAGIFIVAAIITIFLHDPPREVLKEKQPFTLRPIIDNPTFRRFVIANSIMSFAMALGWPIFPIVRATYATPKENTWIWSIFALLQIVTLLISYKFINKIGRKKLLYFGRFIMFYVPLNLAITIQWVPTWWHLSLASVISGASNAFYMVGQSSYILDCAPLEEKGTYTGVHNLFIGIVTFLGSLIMGIIADVLIARYDESNVLFILHLVVAGARLLAATSFLFIKEPKSIKKETTQVE